MPTGIKFIPSLVNGTSTVGVGLSTIVGPTGPAGAFGGPQGLIGPQGPSNGGSPTGTNYGDYLYWNGTGSFVVGDNNINLGSKSGEQSVGLYNVAIGYNAGFTGGFSSGDPFASTATGASIAIGYYAGYEQACNSIAIGNLAGYFQDFNNIAIGSSAGIYQYEINNIAIGINAGAYYQGTGGRQYGQGGNSIAIGSSAGLISQEYDSVAIGYSAGNQKQGHNSVAIGPSAGEIDQGDYSIAIGFRAGQNNQPNESIIINGTSGNIDASTGGLFIQPIRNAISSQTLLYNPSTKEITYSTGSNGSQGLAGPTGANGNQGFQGIQGNQGNQGIQGFQGLIGSTGADGSQGNIGFQGLIGSTGADGSQGNIGIGSQGNQGSIGPIGGTNTQILFNQTGIATGSSNLTYNYTNNMVTLPNVTASSGSFSNLLVSSANIRLGGGAGSINQRTSSIAIGNSSGQTNQGTGTSSQGYSVAIGHLSGNNNQGYGSVGIGYSSGQTNQGELSVSIGTSSGNISQGTRSIGIGQGSGYQYQGNYSISMGDSSGQDYQGTESVAIGRSAGLTRQNPYSVAIGPYAGSSYQSTGNVNAGSVAIGSHSGQTLQQYQAVALGYYAGSNNQGANSIAIGANAGYTNQSNNSIIINASGNQINSTGSGLFINPLRTYTQQGIMTYNTSSSEIAYSTTTASIPNLTVTTMTGGTIYANKINIDQGGIYFSTGSKTGCFISGLNYNSTGADHYVYYNSQTNELTQSSPVYFFSYSTGVQTFTGTSTFYPIGFDANNILYHTFQHVGKSSVFTGTFQSQVVLGFEYSLQMHTTANGVYTTAAALYLDDVPIPGSYRSVSVKDNNTEYILSNDIIVTIPSGGHKIELKAATTNTSTQIGGVPLIPSPGESYTSANLRCSRII